MKISKAGLDLIKSFEGYHRALPDGRCEAYQCPAGKWTIGWGCTVGVTPGMVWTRDEATMALRREVARFETAVARLVTVPLTQQQFDALVSFAYNCGENALARSTILKRVNAGDMSGAAGAFGAWTRGGGRVLPGLVRRRQREAELFLSSAPAAPDEPEMAQAVEQDGPRPAAPLRRSGTVWGTLTGVLAAAGAYAETTLASLAEWASKLGELSPVSGALASLGGNVKSMTLALALGAGVYVISRRVRAAGEEKPG